MKLQRLCGIFPPDIAGDIVQPDLTSICDRSPILGCFSVTCGQSSPPPSKMALFTDLRTQCLDSMLEPSAPIRNAEFCLPPVSQYNSTGSSMNADSKPSSANAKDSLFCLLSSSDTGTLQSSPSGPTNCDVSQSMWLLEWAQRKAVLGKTQSNFCPKRPKPNPRSSYCGRGAHPRRCGPQRSYSPIQGGRQFSA